MGAGLQPVALDQRGLGQGGAADDVGLADGGFEGIQSAFERSGRNALLAQRFGQYGSAYGAGVPDVDVFDVAHGAHGAGHEGGDAAGPQHQQASGVLSRQKIGAQGGGTGGAAGGDGITVDEGQRHAGGGTVEHVGGVQAGQALGAVGGEDVDGLDTEEAGFVPGRHDQGGALHALAFDGVGVAQRYRGALVEGFAQGGDEGTEGQCAVALVGVELFHRDSFGKVM